MPRGQQPSPGSRRVLPIIVFSVAITPNWPRGTLTEDRLHRRHHPAGRDRAGSVAVAELGDGIDHRIGLPGGDRLVVIGEACGAHRPAED